MCIKHLMILVNNWTPTSDFQDSDNKIELDISTHIMKEYKSQSSELMANL